MYHLWTESRYKPPGPVDPTSTTGGPPVITDPEIQKKNLDEKLSAPLPKQCYRHIYRDERGQLRTVVICTTHGHPQRVYHDM